MLDAENLPMGTFLGMPLLTKLVYFKSYYLSLSAHTALVGAMAVPPGVAHTDGDPTLMDGEVGGAQVEVGGALPQGGAVDPTPHEPLQVLNISVQCRVDCVIIIAILTGFSVQDLVVQADIDCRVVCSLSY